MKWSAIVSVGLMGSAVTAMFYESDRALTWAVLAVAVAILSLHDRG